MSRDGEPLEVRGRIIEIVAVTVNDSAGLSEGVVEAIEI